MMNEIKHIKQHVSEPKRRWFFDPEMDLTVWLNETDDIIGFQLTYDRPLSPHALTWIKEKGYFHNRVDDGECPETMAEKGTPILLPDGNIDTEKIGDEFRRKSEDIDRELAEFVYNKILACWYV